MDEDDRDFAALISSIDTYDTVVLAGVGAARDVARDLEDVLMELEDMIHDLLPPEATGGGEGGRVCLEIEVAQLAIIKLAQITNALETVEARRGRR
jgi:hypothetical protein